MMTNNIRGVKRGRKGRIKRKKENILLNTVELQNFIIQLLLLLKPLFKLDPYFSSE